MPDSNARRPLVCFSASASISRDKAAVKRLAERGQIITRPEDLLKSLLLEFLGLDEKADYSETDLESAAMITHLERFLLELGKGFLLRSPAEAVHV